MTNYELIMTLLLQGSSYRTIQAQCGAAHATIAKARKALDQHAITTQQQLEGCSDDDLVAMGPDPRMVDTEDLIRKQISG